MNSFNVPNQKDEVGKPTTSMTKLKFVESLFQYYVTHAIWILLQNCGGTLNTKKLKTFHKSIFHLSKKVKSRYQHFYDDLLKKPTKTLKASYTKLRKASYEEMSEIIYDPDFCQIYKILKTICKGDLHLPILKELIPDLDFSRTYFEIDIISHNVYKWRKKTD